MLGFAEVQRHVADEITLLCDRHHRERTSGLLPIEVVKRANESPYNLRPNIPKPYDLHYSGAECEVVIGGNRFTTRDRGYGTAMSAVSVDGDPLLGFILTEGHLLLNLNVFDEFNRLVLRIVNNELFYSVSPWDIELVGRNLVVREPERNFLIDIDFEVPNRVVINRARLLRNGVEIIVRPEYVLLANSSILISGMEAADTPGGLLFGPHNEQIAGVFSMDGIPRYLGDRTQAEQWARDTMKDLGTRKIAHK
jgi:trigger factor